MLSSEVLIHFLICMCCQILQINMTTKLMTTYGPLASERLSLGVLAIRIPRKGEILVGSGDGTVAILKVVEKDDKRIIKKYQ